MDNIKEKVLKSLKWKKNSFISAQKCGMSENEYLKIKKEILNDKKKQKKKNRFFLKAADNAQLVESIDLEKGEGKISGTFNHEPKSAQEIVQLLKIDTDRWRLSQYWNKQMGDHWRVSALISQIKNSDEKHFEELLKNWKPQQYKLPKTKLNKKGEKVCAIMSLQDIHFGKQGNETIERILKKLLLIY